MKFSIAQWEFSIFLDYRGKRKEHNILNARRKAEKDYKLVNIKRKLVVQNVDIMIIQIYCIFII